MDYCCYSPLQLQNAVATEYCSYNYCLLLQLQLTATRERLRILVLMWERNFIRRGSVWPAGGVNHQNKQTEIIPPAPPPTSPPSHIKSLSIFILTISILSTADLARSNYNINYCILQTEKQCTSRDTSQVHPPSWLKTRQLYPLQLHNEIKTEISWVLLFRLSVRREMTFVEHFIPIVLGLEEGSELM